MTAGEVPEIPCALYLSGYDHLSALPSFCEGLYQVQDLSSMQVALWSEVKAEDQVLDVCAAPGRKGDTYCRTSERNRSCGSERSDRV